MSEPGAVATGWRRKLSLKTESYLIGQVVTLPVLTTFRLHAEMRAEHRDVRTSFLREVDPNLRGSSLLARHSVDRRSEKQPVSELVLDQM